MNSKTVLVVIVIIVLIILAVGLYFIFFAPKNAPAGTALGGAAANGGQAGTLPAAGNQYNPGGANGGGTGASGGGLAASANPPLAKNFGVIANDPVLDYAVTANNTVYAIEPDGKIISVVKGEVSTLSSLAIQGILNAGFSYDGTKALVNFGDLANPQTSVFDAAKKAWAPLRTGMQSPVWSPTDYRIAYLANGANGTETFATVNAAQPKAQPAAQMSLHAQDLAVSWPGKNQAMLYTKPTAYAAGSAWLFDLQSRALAPVRTETPGFAVAWSSNPKTATSMGLAFSVGTSGLGGYLQLIDSSGNAIQRLKFLTLPSKCAFAPAAPAGSAAPGTSTSTQATYLYCAVPRDQDKFSVSHLPDDYNQRALFTSDDIYRINLATGAIDTVLADSSQNFDVSDIKIFNNTLFFINRYDTKLYALQFASQ